MSSPYWALKRSRGRTASQSQSTNTHQTVVTDRFKPGKRMAKYIFDVSLANNGWLIRTLLSVCTYGARSIKGTLV